MRPGVGRKRWTSVPNILPWIYTCSPSRIHKSLWAAKVNAQVGGVCLANDSSVWGCVRKRLGHSDITHRRTPKELCAEGEKGNEREEDSK